LIASAVRALIGEFSPDEIYYLAAYHHSAQDNTDASPILLEKSYQIHVLAFSNFLEAVRELAPETRVFYASSSRVFGNNSPNPQTEESPISPDCVYGLTKAAGMALADYFRRQHGLYVSCGILYNHESPLRAERFVSKRVVNGLVRIKNGLSSRLEIGNLSASVDWGYAPDYTQAMQLMLKCRTPRDFVVASGTLHTIRDMVIIAADYLGVPWERYVSENPKLLQRKSQGLSGDSSLLRRETGWRPSVEFGEMVKLLVDAATP
jgi:GDPmannose 4,6-dehydratase